VCSASGRRGRHGPVSARSATSQTRPPHAMDRRTDACRDTTPQRTGRCHNAAAAEATRRMRTLDGSHGRDAKLREAPAAVLERAPG